MPRVPAVPRLVQCFAVWLAVLAPVSLSLVSVALYMLARPLPPASFASAAAATVSRLATPRALTALAAAVLPAAVMARFFQPVRYYLRLTIFLVSLGANSVWGVCVSIIMSLAGRGKDINYVVARSFEASTAPLLGVTLRVEGREHLDQNRPAVLVGNHQTMVDILCEWARRAETSRPSADRPTSTLAFSPRPPARSPLPLTIHSHAHLTNVSSAPARPPHPYPTRYAHRTGRPRRRLPAGRLDHGQARAPVHAPLGVVHGPLQGRFCEPRQAQRRRQGVCQGRSGDEAPLRESPSEPGPRQLRVTREPDP